MPNSSLPNESNLPVLRAPAEYLREVFQARKERNTYYSQSAFARDLGVSVSILSRVMSGERPMSLKLGLQVATALGLSEAEANSLTHALIEHAPAKAKISRRVRERLAISLSAAARDATPVYTTVEIERFKLLAQWFHLAILNLVDVEGFRHEPSALAKALGITVSEAAGAVDRLIGLGLLEEVEGRLKRSQKNFYVKTQKSETAIRKFHEQMITKALHALQKSEDPDFHRRLINGITFSCAGVHLEAIKDRIDRCQDEILALVGDGAADSVYQMNVQLFPLTEKNSPHSSKDSGETQ